MSGQLTYAVIREADLGPLREAVGKWNHAPGRFQQIGVNFRTEVTQGLIDSGWEGESADAARKKFRAVQEQVQAAAEEARRVHKVLREGLNEFTAAQKALDGIEEELRGHRHLRLDKKDGSVTLELKGEEEKDRASLTESYREAIADYERRTRAAIRRASDADRDLTRALSADVNGVARGFNATAYESLEQARRQTEKDVRAALHIASLDPSELNARKLTQLDTLMARHSLDPFFAERFATGLGPEKTLRLWYNATHPQGSYEPGWLKSAKSLQENLGETLGTATRSNSTAMREWENDLIRLGPERLETDGAAARPYGFQIAGNLMRFGTWDADFLNKYGDKLIEFDKKHNTRDGFAYWSNNSSSDFLNLHDKNDNGQDPVTGFLEALGHNPAAATEFFGQPEGVDGIVDKDSELNSHLKYLTKDRNWIFDGYEGDPRKLPGHEALGHALVAATTGYAWDDEAFEGKEPEVFKSGGDRRTEATANVMEQVVHIYGSEEAPKLLHEQPGIAQSLGSMAGAYIDDINYAVTPLGDTGPKDEEAFPSAYDGRAGITKESAVNFLSVVGQNEDSYKEATRAQHVYTLSRLGSAPPSDEGNLSAGERVLKAEAQTRGILDFARANQAEATFKDDAKAANESIGRSTNWKSTLAGTAVGTAAGIALMPIVGPAGSVTIAPVATEASVELINQFISQEAERAAEEKDPTQEVQKTRNELFRETQNDLGTALSNYIEGHNVSEERQSNLTSVINGNYMAIGPKEGEYLGRAAYTED